MNPPQPSKHVSDAVKIVEKALDMLETGPASRRGLYAQNLPMWFAQVETAVSAGYAGDVSHGVTIHLAQFMFPRGKHDLDAKKAEYLAGIEKTYQGLNDRMSACKDRAQKLGIVVG